MVTICYQVTQQMNRLSPPERRDLHRVLEGGRLQPQATPGDASGRFVSSFGTDNRVVWSKDEQGNIVVWTIIAE